MYKGYKLVEGNTDDINKQLDCLDDLYTNEYVIIRNTDDGTEKELRFDGSRLVGLSLPPSKFIKAKNSLQRCALDLLNNQNLYAVGLFGGYGCVDKDTEYFNGKKWVPISEYVEGDEVLQYNEDGIAQLVKPDAYIKNRCDYVYHFESDLLDQVLSDNHRVIHYNPGYRPGRYFDIEYTDKTSLHESAVKQILGEKNPVNRYIPLTFNYSSDGLDVPDIILRISFVAAVLGSNKEKASHIITNGKQQYRYVVDLLKEGAVSFTQRSRSETDKKLIISSVKIYNGKLSIEHWGKCNKHQLEILCQQLLELSKIPKQRDLLLRHDTLDKDAADFIQFMFASLGYTTQITGQYTRYVLAKTRKEKITEKRMDRFRVDVYKNEQIPKLPDEYTKEKTEDGYVYCFSVPSTMLVLRRNGKIFITGNSGKTYLGLQMALYSVNEKGRQSKIVGVREVIGTGKEVGYLPGELDDKVGNFFLPLQQSLAGGEFELQSLKQMGKLEIYVPYYMKGLTLNDSIIVVDECEDLTEKQVKLIGTRLGENSRIFFCGDYKQSEIDSSSNNPCVRMAEELKGNPHFGCIYLEEDVRSEGSQMFVHLFE